MGWMEIEAGLDKTEANFVPLTPLSHLQRAAKVFPTRIAVVYNNHRVNYAEYYSRCSQLASALVAVGVKRGSVVATILPNVPAQAEAHFGVPACGAVLNTINTRLDVDTVSYIFGHGEAKVVLVDSQFLALAESACAQLGDKAPLIIEVSDSSAGFESTGKYTTYEQFLSSGDKKFKWLMPEDEWESLALNYTSGTTGRPKGVVYHHRGAYLMTMGTVVSWRMQIFPVFLTIVPLFHCNGWNHTWLMPMVGGKLVCCREISAEAIYNAISDEKVAFFGGAPIVLNLIVNADQKERKPFEHRVEVFTAGAPPAPATLDKMEKLGFNVTQVYGLTETYGHVTQCAWNDDWNEFDEDKQNEIKARQGVRYPNTEGITVMNPETMKEVPNDGKTIGEIMIKGNVVMKGYFKDKEATEKAMKDGWFHSGDLAVMHPDGYVKIQDRSKDIIISGGENISSIEIENTLAKHPSVSIAAVVAKPDDKWGEVPCAFIEIVKDKPVTEKELISFCKETLANFKVPKKIEFCDLPKTSTGKIQKFELRKKAKEIK